MTKELLDYQHCVDMFLKLCTGDSNMHHARAHGTKICNQRAELKGLLTHYKNELTQCAHV